MHEGRRANRRRARDDASRENSGGGGEDATGSRPNRPFHVRSHERSTRPEATIITTLRAPADRAVHLLNCNGATGVGLQRKVGDEWVYAWAVAMNACLSPVIVVPPGGEHTARVYLHENSGGVMYPERAPMIESGIYRVVWTGVLLSFDPDVRGFGPELPLEQRVSAPITIEVPPASDSHPESTGTTP